MSDNVLNQVIDDYKFLYHTEKVKRKELQKIIDKAIEYIKNHQEERTYYTPEQRWETTKYFVKGYYELLEILGDKE